MSLPDGISLNQWYPERLVSLPKKLSYYDGDDIDLDKMVFRFVRYVKKDKKIQYEEIDVEYKDFKVEFKGWNFKLKTKKTLLSSATNGKMKIEFSFVLKDKDKSFR